DATQLRQGAQPVLWLAVPGTIATAALVGLVLVLTLHMPIAVALLFGSIVSATDPVAVVGVFRNLDAPRRLAVLVEGESLINDGVAITLYTATVTLVTSGNSDVPGALGLSVREAVGAVAIGAVLALVFWRLAAAVADPPVDV